MKRQQVKKKTDHLLFLDIWKNFFFFFIFSSFLHVPGWLLSYILYTSPPTTTGKLLYFSFISFRDRGELRWHLVRCALLNSRAERPENNRYCWQPGSRRNRGKFRLTDSRLLASGPAVTSRKAEYKIDRENQMKWVWPHLVRVYVDVPCVSSPVLAEWWKRKEIFVFFFFLEKERRKCNMYMYV